MCRVSKDCFAEVSSSKALRTVLTADRHQSSNGSVGESPCILKSNGFSGRWSVFARANRQMWSGMVVQCRSRCVSWEFRFGSVRLLSALWPCCFPIFPTARHATF